MDMPLLNMKKNSLNVPMEQGDCLGVEIIVEGVCIACQRMNVSEQGKKDPI
jgi:hypothetical protein